MNLRTIAAALLPIAITLGCAPDHHGDLRTQVDVQDHAGHPRVAYRGIEVGMGIPAAFEALGEQPDPVWGGSWLLRGREADFGTRLDAIFARGPEHAIQELSLVYQGNPVAIGRVQDRWIEALGLAGRDCDPGCYWDDGDALVASLRRERGWTLKDELTVTLYR